MFYPHLNQPDRANEVYEISREYLLGHEDLTNRIQDHLRARYEVNDVVTETAPKLESGHFFPFLESYTELELSLSLALLGFYRHAFDSLRSSFELCVAGVYYDREDDAESKIEAWFHSNERTPQFKKMIQSLTTIPGYEAFHNVSDFEESLEKNYDALGGFVHTRGFPYSSSRLSGSNVLQFSETSLRGFADFFCEIAHSSVILILLKYPMGLQPVPLFQKFGPWPPLGGFLDDGAQAAVRTILSDDEYIVLRAISDADPDVLQIVKGIEDLPDLTDEELEQQAKDWESLKTELRKGT